MNRLLPQLILMLSGAALLVVGVILVFIQVSAAENATDVSAAMSQRVASGPDPKGMEITTHSLDISTKYIGLEVIAIGAALEVFGFLGGALIKLKSPT
jgi:hypothetical protein